MLLLLLLLELLELPLLLVELLGPLVVATAGAARAKASLEHKTRSFLISDIPALFQ